METKAKQNTAANRLINEKSPYLLQHAHNPVDWHPWDDVAINKAKAENKPIILSIGYSTCHWCHVMEKESFEDQNIADIMNRYFVSIKVDREERPDLDAIYMTAVTSMTGSGGWPLNVFLTPDLKPFFGGTYFPAASGFQMFSWPDLLNRIARMWQDTEEKQKIFKAGESLMANIAAYLSKPAGSRQNNKTLSLEPVNAAYNQYVSMFDEKNGGFGSAPKFPSPVIQNFLFAYGGDQKSSAHRNAVYMAETTLSAMARGGIFDHLGGGFHRYATDGKWHVPHFEKMLYDNAQLIVNYLAGYRITGKQWFADIAAETADYVIRDLTDAEGGFYSAEDADSVPADISGQRREGPVKKVEGAFYVWEKKEVERILDHPAGTDVFLGYFDIKSGGNVEHDPHGYFGNKNVLAISENEAAMADKAHMTVSEFHQAIRQAKTKLLKARTMRPRPHLDDKIITSWNGLMISALSKACQILNREKYLSAAQSAASFIKDQLYDAGSGRLYRRWRLGEKKVWGMAEDHAYLIQGLLDLYAADDNKTWLNWAVELMESQVKGFYDKDQGGFFMTAENHDPNMILRVKEENDNVMPSANAVSALNLIRLSRMAKRADFYPLAEETVAFYFSKMQQFPGSMPQMLIALMQLITEKS